MGHYRIIISFGAILYCGSLFACSCIGEQSVKKAYKSSDIVVSGQVVTATEIKVWADTSSAQRGFDIWRMETGDYSISYEDYKWKNYLYGPNYMEFGIVVIESFKNATKLDTIKVRTGFGGGDCGFEFQVGVCYLIYATNPKHYGLWTSANLEHKQKLTGIFQTDICDRTRTVEQAEEDLKKLKKN